ncbi:MAG: hypothetical protein LC105_04715 [Chitinophagales bacterium]|nr:hypothetical protein [Chitinophagales bacterium]MCZ2393140.1 hypothetical protein [Chitinophagales bacterium]
MLFKVFSANCFAGGEYRAIGTRMITPGLGGVSIISPYSASSNQAALGFSEHSSVAVYYANTGISEGVNNFLMMGQYHLPKGGTIGFTGSYFGYHLFNDKKIGIGYGLKLADFVSIGAQIDILNNHVSGYGANTAVTFELGTLFKINQHIQAGLHIYNPARVRYGKNTEERVPTVFRLGATYTTKEKIWITSEIEQDLDLNLAFRVGIDYLVNPYLIIRGNMLSYPLSGTLGVGLKYKSAQFEISGAYQKITGVSPHLGISYEF